MNYYEKYIKYKIKYYQIAGRIRDDLIMQEKCLDMVIEKDFFKYNLLPEHVFQFIKQMKECNNTDMYIENNTYYLALFMSDIDNFNTLMYCYMNEIQFIRYNFHAPIQNILIALDTKKYTDDLRLFYSCAYNKLLLSYGNDFKTSKNFKNILTILSKTSSNAKEYLDIITNNKNYKIKLPGVIYNLNLDPTRENINEIYKYGYTFWNLKKKIENNGLMSIYNFIIDTDCFKSKIGKLSENFLNFILIYKLFSSLFPIENILMDNYDNMASHIELNNIIKNKIINKDSKLIIHFYAHGSENGIVEISTNEYHYNINSEVIKIDKKYNFFIDEYFNIILKDVLNNINNLSIFLESCFNGYILKDRMHNITINNDKLNLLIITLKPYLLYYDIFFELIDIIKSKKIKEEYVIDNIDNYIGYIIIKLQENYKSEIDNRFLIDKINKFKEIINKYDILYIIQKIIELNISDYKKIYYERTGIYQYLMINPLLIDFFKNMNITTQELNNKLIKSFIDIINNCKIKFYNLCFLLNLTQIIYYEPMIKDFLLDLIINSLNINFSEYDTSFMAFNKKEIKNMKLSEFF